MVSGTVMCANVWVRPLLVQMCCRKEKTMQRPALADYPAGARLPERVLDDYELVWMVRGRALVEGRTQIGRAHV